MSTRKKICFFGFFLIVSVFMAVNLFGCGTSSKYAFKKDISDIVCAEITNVISDGRTITDIEVLAYLKKNEAQTLATEISCLNCKSITPPVHTISDLTVIFYYSDGSREMISEQSSRYIKGEKASYYCNIFDLEEFSSLLHSSISDR